MSECYPVGLRRDGDDALIIDWSDGSTRRYGVAELRDHCPCATCREKRAAPPPDPKKLPIVSQSRTEPLRIADMKPVGSYAYSIVYSDGHDTGIYTLELLRELGTEVEDPRG